MAENTIRSDSSVTWCTLLSREVIQRLMDHGTPRDEMRSLARGYQPMVHCSPWKTRELVVGPVWRDG